MRRVHVIGPPRSGTTLMLELMSNGFAFTAASPHEVSVLEVPAGLGDDASYLTKNPQDHRQVAPLIDRDTRQWFISMVRDPRDIVCSRHGLHPEVYWANLRQWRTWLENTRAFRAHPRLIEVRYESLVRGPDQLQQALARQLPFLAVTSLFSRFHEVAQPSGQSVTAMRSVRPISDSSVGKWRENLPRLAGQIELHGPITQELIELGYESDETWLQLLDNVKPDTRPGHWPDFISQEFTDRYRERNRQQREAYLKARGL